MNFSLFDNVCDDLIYIIFNYLNFKNINSLIRAYPSTKDLFDKYKKNIINGYLNPCDLYHFYMMDDYNDEFQKISHILAKKYPKFKEDILNGYINPFKIFKSYSIDEIRFKYFKWIDISI